MKVLVCGGRNYSNTHELVDALEDIGGITEIIHGGAYGADAMAGGFAKANDIKETVYPAYWKKHGRAAGPIRNKQMLDDGKPDLVVAFKGGRGTDNMVKQALAAGVKVIRP